MTVTQSTGTGEQRLGLAHFASVDPSASAIIDQDGTVWTREDVVGFANRFSRALRARGIRAGDAVAIISENRAEYLVTYFAAMQIGAYLVPVNWHLSLEELVHVLRQSGARALIIDDRRSVQAMDVREALERVGEQITLRISICPEAGFVTLEDLVSEHDAGSLEAPITGRVLVFTSATTGFPKCVVRPLQSADRAREKHLRIVASLNHQAGIRTGMGTHLCQSMLYHTVPLSHAASAMNLGQRVALMGRWNAERALQLIERYEVESTFMVPSMFVQLLKLPERVRRGYSAKSLKLVTHGAAPTPIEIKREMIEWWGLVVHELYGASEGFAAGATAEEWLKNPGTVGRAHPGIDIKILDESGTEQPRGAAGLIYIRSHAGERFEYLNDPQRTREAYRGDYFTAGDIGHLNEAGYLFICDRAIDLVIRGGINVYPAEIERTLVLHSAIADCAVFGVPDPIFGEALIAAIQLRSGLMGDGQISSDIFRHLAKRLSPEKIPSRLEYVPELPRDPAGKMQKRRLREAFAPR